MVRFDRIVCVLIILLAALGCRADAERPGAPSVDAAAVSADLSAWIAWSEQTHPKLSHSADAQALKRAVEAMRARLDGTYDARQAWHALSVLNPLLNDAHLGLRAPEAAFERHLAEGGAAFSAPVRIEAGRLFVADSIAPGSRLDPDDEILSINGRDAGAILADMIARMRGETETLRARVAELRFAIALWAVQGDADAHVVELRAPDGARRRVRLVPERDGAGPSPAPFALDIKRGVAVLTVDTFDRAREQAFADFLADAFAEIDISEVEHLVIDLRRNGGGAQELSNRLMAYLTDQRHTPISAVVARITPENQALVPGSRIGEVIDTPFAQWVEPPQALPGRFEGETVILIGPHTYSQAIAFAATAQDFGVASLAGAPTDGAANQTGQVQRFTLPNTGLEAIAPIYIFTRASGETGRAALQPDLVLPGAPRGHLDSLLERLRRDAP